jgi:pentose-5-phosphate-3-epimerase
MENQLNTQNSQDGLFHFELMDAYPRMTGDFISNDIIDIHFEEEVNLDKLIEKIESNEVDKIFKEIKSTIVN